MKKFIYTVGACIMASSIMSIFKAHATNGDLTLQSSDEPSIYSGHRSHCSHASHYSMHRSNKSEKISLVKRDSLYDVSVETKYQNLTQNKCIIGNVYVSVVEFKKSYQSIFCGEAMIISIMDNYGNYGRSPKIKITTHVIPIDKKNNSFFTSNGHLGFSEINQINQNLEEQLNDQFENGDWIIRDKFDWMKKFDKHFYDNIIELTY